MAAFVRWSLNGSTVVALLPANTDTEWFESVWFWCHEIRLLTGRVNFLGSRGGNTGGSMVAVYRPNPVQGFPEPGCTVEITDDESMPRVALWDWRGAS